MQLDYSKLHAALDAMENKTPVFAAIEGEIKECELMWFGLKPLKFFVKVGRELRKVSDIFFEHPGMDIPEAGREVRHKATGLIIRSAGYLRNGKLVDDKGQEWGTGDWEDTELLERRRKEEEAKRKAEEDQAARDADVTKGVPLKNL